MTKQTGLGDNFYLAGYDLSGDVGSIGNVACPQGTIDVTDISQSAYERRGGQRDGMIEWSSFFNDDTGRAHPVLKALPTTDIDITYCRGTTIGSAAACLRAKQINYDPTRGDDGSLTIAVQATANAYGLEWGQLLTAGKRTDTTATNGASLDTTASVSFGWQAYLQAFALTGTSCTVTIEDSVDNAAWATLSGAAFTAFTTNGTQRLQAASGTATVRRYVRAITSGTFTSATFAVVLIKNESAVVF